jgi:predicted ATPase
MSYIDRMAYWCSHNFPSPIPKSELCGDCQDHLASRLSITETTFRSMLRQVFQATLEDLEQSFGFLDRKSRLNRAPLKHFKPVPNEAVYRSPPFTF